MNEKHWSENDIHQCRYWFWIEASPMGTSHSGDGCRRTGSRCQICKFFEQKDTQRKPPEKGKYYRGLWNNVDYLCVKITPVQVIMNCMVNGRDYRFAIESFDAEFELIDIC